MENINNIDNLNQLPEIQNTPLQSKNNLFKYLFIFSVLILLTVTIFFIIKLNNINSKLSLIQQKNDTPIEANSTKITPTETVNQIATTTTNSNSIIKSKIRAYSYKFNRNTEEESKVFKSIAPGSLGQMYVSLILEEEDTSNYAKGPILKDFMLTVINKQLNETYRGTYSEANGKLTLNFEEQITKSYDLPKVLNLDITENSVIIDGVSLVRNDNTTKTYGYTYDLNEDPKIFSSISGSLGQIYIRLVLDSEQLTPTTFSPNTFLLTSFNKQEQQKYIGNYSLSSNKLTLNYTKYGKAISQSFIVNENSIIIDGTELKIIK